MSMFAKHIGGRKPLVADTDTTQVGEAGLEAVALAATTDDAEFAEQRARRNREHGLESLAVATMDEDDGSMKEDVVVEPLGDDVVVADDVVDDDGENEEDEDDSDLDVVDRDEADIDVLEQQMVQLVDSAIAIESFGINPTALAIMQTTGLLEGTALQSLGLESIEFVSGTHPQSEMALESIGEVIKEKAGQWAAKIVSLVKNAAEKMMSVVNPIWDRITAASKKLGEMAWDKTKSAGALVKAHPYATVAAVVVAIGAVAGVVAFVATGAPAAGAEVGVFTSFLNKVREMISKIHWPFGKVTAAVSSAGNKISVSVAGGMAKTKAASAAALGWTQSSVKALSGQAARAWEATKHSWGTVGKRIATIAGGASEKAKSVVPFAKKTGSKMVKFVTGTAFYSSIASVVATVFRLARQVVVAGFRMVLNTFRSLFRIGGGVAETAAAAA